MTEDQRRRAFARKFIAQARSDWGVYETLAERADVVPCHRLLFLQMACEKLAKDVHSALEKLSGRRVDFPSEYTAAKRAELMKAW